MTDYTFDQIIAADPSNPSMVASNGVVTLFTPGDATKTPLELKTVYGQPLPNPVTVNKLGMGPAYIAPLWEVAWEGGGLSGLFRSNIGLRDEAVAASQAAQEAANAASTASTDAVALVQEQLDVSAANAQTSANIALEAQTEIATARQAAEDAAAAAEGGGFAEDPGDPDAFIVTTKADGSVAVDPDDADALIFTT